MSQNQEIIESKLCAYIDGELDPEGRAEIEKHLEANPQHRRLLESLRATRDLIRWLPREPAPPEIAETLNGQLERSVLLNYEGEHLGPNIWPRVFAAAAIVALTTGLGVAVYYALPRSQGPAQLALHAPRAPESGNGDVVPAPPATTDETRGEAPRMADVDRLDAAPRSDRESIASKAGPDDKAGKALAVASPRGGANLADDGKVAGRMVNLKENEAGDLDQLAKQVAENPGAFMFPSGNTANNVAQNGNATQNGNSFGTNAMVLLVRSDAPDRTERQLTAYFNEQQIQWRQAPLTFQSEANLQQPTPGSGGATQNQMLRRTQDHIREELATTNGVIETAKKAEQREPQTFAMKMANASDRAPTVPEARRLGGAAAPTTQPVPGVVAAAKEEYRDAAGAAQQNVPTTPLQIQQDAMQVALANSIRSDGVYVCQMSRRQATELSNTFANYASPPAQVKDLGAVTNNSSYAAAGENAATPSNDTRSQAAQSQLMAKSAGGYGAGGSGGADGAVQQRSMKGGIADPSGQSLKQTADKAADSSQYAVPPSAPAAAPANGEPAGPSAAIAGKPGSEPLANQSLSDSTSAPQRAPMPAPAPPATQPSQSALTPTAPADEPVNVVIMVQGNPPTSATGTASPASQSASQPPSQQPQTAPPSASQAPQQAK